MSLTVKTEVLINNKKPAFAGYLIAIYEGGNAAYGYKLAIYATTHISALGNINVFNRRITCIKEISAPIV